MRNQQWFPVPRSISEPGTGNEERRENVGTGVDSANLVHVIICSMSGFVQIQEGLFVMGCDSGQPDEAPAHRVWVHTFELAIDR